MKFKIQHLVVVLLLVLFPLISWLYLKNGINFRKEALDQLSSKGELERRSLDSATMVGITGKIVLFNLKGSKEALSRINDQFKESTDFLILSGESGNDIQLSNQEVEGLRISYPDKSYVLVDNEGKVRRTYSETESEMKLLVVHIATLIPFVEKKKPRGIK